MPISSLRNFFSKNAKRINSAQNFQESLYRKRRENPLLIEELFPDSTAPRPRLIVLTDSSRLHGREFFLRNLKAEILFEIPDDFDDKDVVAFFGYDDFVDAVPLLERRNIERILLFEAGFLRGILMDSSGSMYDRAWCFFVDDLGFHYDPKNTSRLELMLNDPHLAPTTDQLKRAAALRETMVRERLTKYNDQRIVKMDRSGSRPRVLVVEQARRDWAIRKSGGNATSFETMVRTALRDNPDAEIILKIHPDTLNGKRGGITKSYFGNHRDDDRITVLREKINPLSLLETVDKVYVFSSMLGFEALMMEKEVHLFGRPCYGGWGLTIDYQNYPARSRRRSLDEMVYFIYFVYQRYKNAAGSWCPPEEAVSALIALRDAYLAAEKAETPK